jgi:hypothetical protein
MSFAKEYRENKRKKTSKVIMTEIKIPMTCPGVKAQSLTGSTQMTQLIDEETNTNIIRIKNKLGVQVLVNQLQIKIEHKNATNLQSSFEVRAIRPGPQTILATSSFIATSNNTGIATVNLWNPLIIGVNKTKEIELMIIPLWGLHDTIHDFEVVDIDFSSRNGPSQFTGCPNVYEAHHGNATIGNNPINLNSTHVYETGILKIYTGHNIPGKILVSNDKENVFAINFSAGIDDIEISDIYLENDTDNDEIADNTGVATKVDFKLFNHDAQLLAQEQMNSNGKIEFELQNNNRIIVPKNSSRTVYVEAEIRSINNLFFERKLKLSIDTNNSSSVNGVEAVSATNGINLNSDSIAGDATSEEFLLHRSKLTI